MTPFGYNDQLYTREDPFYKTCDNFTKSVLGNNELGTLLQE